MIMLRKLAKQVLYTVRVTSGLAIGLFLGSGVAMALPIII